MVARRMVGFGAAIRPPQSHGMPRRLAPDGAVAPHWAALICRLACERLDPLIVKRSPLAVPVKKPKATWVQPIVEAEIEYSGFTDDGLLRAAVFKGLRDDLGPPKP